MPRRGAKAQEVDYLRVYPGINDFGDALEALPAEAIKHMTHLKEIDAKTDDTRATLRKRMLDMLKPSPREQTQEQKAEATEKRKTELRDLRGVLLEFLPCLEEKMHVATLASEALRRHVARIDTDFNIICDQEIPQLVQIDPNDPALQEIKIPTAQANQRSGARREAIAARKAAAAAAVASAAESSRAGTPVGNSNGNHANGSNGSNNNNHGSGQTTTTGRPGRRGRTATPLPAQTAQVAHNNTAAEAPGLSNGHSHGHGNGRHDSHKNETVVEEVEEKPALKRRRDDDAADIGEPSPRRRRNPAPDEPTYCYCDQGSYGDMVACDGPECRREWFHLGCIGLSAPPKGQWFCEECQARYRRR